MYALNLDAETNRILSACIANGFTPESMPRVDILPEGDLYDYLYVNENFIHSPLPEPEVPVEEQIAELKRQLAETDYRAIKYAEGWYTEEEYAPYRAEREAIRERIRQLESYFF